MNIHGHKKKIIDLKYELKKLEEDLRKEKSQPKWKIDEDIIKEIEQKIRYKGKNIRSWQRKLKVKKNEVKKI